MIPTPTPPMAGHPYKYSNFMVFCLFMCKVKIPKLYSLDENRVTM